MDTSGANYQLPQTSVTASPGEPLTDMIQEANVAQEKNELQPLVMQLGTALALPTAQELVYQSAAIGAPNPADAGEAANAGADDGSIPLLDFYFPLIQDALNSALNELETGNMGMTAGLSHYNLQPDIRRTHSHPRHYSTQARKTAGREMQDRQSAQSEAQSFSATPKMLDELSEALTRALDGHAGTPPPSGEQSDAEATALDTTAQEKWANYLKSFQAISNTLDVMHVMMTMNGILKASQRRRSWAS